MFESFLNGIIGGSMVKYLYHGHAIYAILIAGVFRILGGFSGRFVDDVDDVVAVSIYSGGFLEDSEGKYPDWSGVE